MSSLDRHTTPEAIKLGSAKGFGLVFAAVFAIVAFWPLIFGANPPRWWALVIAMGFAAISFLRPSLLNPLNKLWFKFGILLSKIVNPVIMGLIFVLTVIPTGIVMRLLGKRPLQLDEPPERSMWKSTKDKKTSFDNQF
ncbi:MAG: hypothetical protein HKN85_02250 [Gammaproteobacteria bacterium]|nr:hypothetical protein [Gammaproteobacteria bacterium]